MHAPIVTHGLVLTHDQVGRVVAVEVCHRPHAHVAHPREIEVGVLGRLGATLGLLEIEAVDAGSVVMVATDDPLTAVNMANAHLPVVDRHRGVGVRQLAGRAREWHAFRLGHLARVARAAWYVSPRGRRVGRALGQVLEHVGAPAVERAVHCLRVELGRAALPTRHGRHARRARIR